MSAQECEAALARGETSCHHCGAMGRDTGGQCPRCERNRDTGREELCACGHLSEPGMRHGDCLACARANYED